MEHFVPVIASAYNENNNNNNNNNNNKNLNSLVVSEQQFSKYQAEQISRTKLIRLKREQRKSCWPKQTF